MHPGPPLNGGFPSDAHGWKNIHWSETPPHAGSCSRRVPSLTACLCAAEVAERRHFLSGRKKRLQQSHLLTWKRAWRCSGWPDPREGNVIIFSTVPLERGFITRAVFLWLSFIGKLTLESPLDRVELVLGWVCRFFRICVQTYVVLWALSPSSSDQFSKQWAFQ